jgi:hypothetical protein
VINKVRLQLALVCVLLLAALAAPPALADVDHTYWYAYSYAVDGGGDINLSGQLTNYYRYYNDSCMTDGYDWTKSIYGLTDGSWVATVMTFNVCSDGKAHLNPSGSYGYSSVQSKCRIMSGEGYLYCHTSRPS